MYSITENVLSNKMSSCKLPSTCNPEPRSTHRLLPLTYMVRVVFLTEEMVLWFNWYQTLQSIYVMWWLSLVARRLVSLGTKAQTMVVVQLKATLSNTRSQLMPAINSSSLGILAVLTRQLSRWLLVKLICSKSRLITRLVHLLSLMQFQLSLQVRHRHQATSRPQRMPAMPQWEILTSPGINHTRVVLQLLATSYLSDNLMAQLTLKIFLIVTDQSLRLWTLESALFQSLS